MDMRVMTWNIHGAYVWDRDERFPLIQEAIRTYQPDIACIQEAFFPKSRRMLRNIEGYHLSYQTNWFPPTTTKGGLVTLTKAEPQEVSFQPYLTQGNLFTEQRWDRLIGKGFLETVIENEEFGKVTIINTHKVCTYTDDTDEYLEAQTEQLLEKIKKHKERKELIIVAGDFNFKRRSKLYPQFRELLHDAGEDLRDAAEDFHNLHLFEYETIDYIFVGNKHHVEPAHIHHQSWQKYPSDHPGILVDIKPSDR